MKEYHINLFFSEEDDAWIEDIPDLSMCSAFGDTPSEALAELELAKAAWMEAATKTGRPIPAPTYRPVIYQAAF